MEDNLWTQFISTFKISQTNYNLKEVIFPYDYRVVPQLLAKVLIS